MVSSALLLLTPSMAFLEAEILSFLPNFVALFVFSASSSRTAQKSVNKTEI